MKFKQTLLTIVLSLCMVAASLPNIVSADVKPQDRWTDYAAASFDGGSGTEDDPYKIATAEQLAEIPELNRRAAEDIWLFFHKEADSDEK